MGRPAMAVICGLLPSKVSAVAPPVPVMGLMTLAVSSRAALAPLMVSAVMSATAVSVNVPVAVVAEYGVEPPLIVVLTNVPSAPLVLSQARMVRVAVPTKSALGWKNTRFWAASSVARSKALASDMFVSRVQLAPELVEYHHWPLLLSAPTMAMPIAARPVSASAVVMAKLATPMPARVG